FQLVDAGQLHPLRERAVRALARTVDYIEERMPDAIGFDTQRQLLDYALTQVTVSGHYLEFGGYSGGTIRHLARCKPTVTFHGFDSFEGLREAWHGFKFGSGAFARDGRLPRVPANVRLHKGWFAESIHAWCRQTDGLAAFIHIDCNLYS